MTGRYRFDARACVETGWIRVAVRENASYTLEMWYTCTLLKTIHRVRHPAELRESSSEVKTEERCHDGNEKPGIVAYRQALYIYK